MDSQIAICNPYNHKVNVIDVNVPFLRSAMSESGLQRNSPISLFLFFSLFPIIVENVNIL